MKNLKVPQATSLGYIECPLFGVFDFAYPNSKLRRGRVQGGGKISPTIMAGDTTLAVWLGYEEI